MQKQKYTLLLFESGNSKPVETFIKTLEKNTQAKILRIFDLVETYGQKTGMPYVKKIDTDLWEIRIRGKEEVRFIFTVKHTTIYILHGFKKKQNKIPDKEFAVAKKRKKLI